jgi:HD-like signal output (HDOD) protein
MFSWLKRVFSRRAPVSPPTDAPSPLAARRPQSAASAPPADEAFPVVASELPQGACPPELIDQAVTQVLDHFRANQPGPESFPSNATRIIDLIQQREPDFNKLVHAVGQDAAIASRLLQAANSSLYSPGPEVQNVRGAAIRLGLREVGEIALGCAGRALFETEARYQYSLFPQRWDAMFHESMTAAFAAGSLSMRTRRGQPDCAFLAGMLHDVGKPIALRAIAALHLEGALDPLVLDLGVTELLERVHVEIGATMMATWALPEYLQVATTLHHDLVVPADAPDLHLVRVVDALRHARAGTLTELGRDQMYKSAAVLKLTPAELRVAATEYAELAGRVATIFHVRDPYAAPARPTAQRRAV